MCQGYLCEDVIKKRMCAYRGGESNFSKFLHKYYMDGPYMLLTKITNNITNVYTQLLLFIESVTYKDFITNHQNVRKYSASNKKTQKHHFYILLYLIRAP